MKRLACLAFVLVAGCGSLGTSQPHTLSLAYKPGDTYKYRFHSTTKQTATMTAMAVPVNVDTTADESVTVKGVTASGDAQLAVTLSNLTVKTSMGGITNTTTGTPSTTVDVELAPDGRLVTVAGNQAAASSPLLAITSLGASFFVSAVLPDHAVKPGDTWTKEYDQAAPGGKAGAVHITAKSTYLRDESAGGVNAAVVETKSTGNIDFDTTSTATKDGMPPISVKGTFSTDVTTWIDPSGHRIVKSHSTATDDATIMLPSVSPPAAISGPGPGPTPPALPAGLTGPIQLTGTATADLNPA
jgi:hypothetical protein